MVSIKQVVFIYALGLLGCSAIISFISFRLVLALPSLPSADFAAQHPGYTAGVVIGWVVWYGFVGVITWIALVEVGERYEKIKKFLEWVR